MARRRYQKGQVYLCGEMWYGRYREDEIRDGQVVRVRRNSVIGSKREYPTKKLALRRLEQLLGRINSVDYRPGRVATVEQLAERWKTEILALRKPSGIAPKLCALNRYIIPQFGNLRLDSLGAENHQMFITSLTKSVKSSLSVVTIFTTLASMLSTARKWGYICEPVRWEDLVFPPRDPQPGRTFTVEQAKRIISEAECPFKLMYAIAAYCGLRASEITGLRAEDIDLEKQTLTINQTAWRGKMQTAKTRGSETTIPIPGVLRDLLRGNMVASGLLFLNRLGRPYTADKVVTDHLQPLLKKLGIPRAGFHAFRHMHTTLLLLESGASPKVAQRQLRHSNARTTLEVYAHVVEDSHRQAVERAAKYLN